MKKFIHDLGDLKFITGIYFMASIILGTIGGYFHGLREFSFVTIWQIMGMSITFGLLHYIQLSKISAVFRITAHVVLSYATVALFSLFCNWGFTKSAEVFWQFTIIFIVIYALVFMAFSIYYKNEQVCLNKMLDEYKQNNK